MDDNGNVIARESIKTQAYAKIEDYIAALRDLAVYIKENQDTTRHWTNTYEHEVDISNTHDRSHNINDLEITYNLYWARYYNFRPIANGLKLQAGVAANLCTGAIYNMTSSNNPAQARAALNIMPSATATYGFHISRQRFTARYELNLPLVGLMFSPNYGQSYYEIFSLGNYDHNIDAIWHERTPRRQMASSCGSEHSKEPMGSASEWTPGFEMRRFSIATDAPGVSSAART